MKKITALVLTLAALLPLSASALEGTGPRVTVTGVIESMSISAKNVYDEFGGEMTLRATNGQLVNVVFIKETRIIAEGRLSRKEILPLNLTPGMELRVRGWRVGTDGITASLVIISNVELNPALATNGILQSIDDTSVTVLGQDGTVRTYNITNETEVSIVYTLRGMEGLTLFGKEVLLTLNPLDSSLVRSLKITGNKEAANEKPTTLQLGRRRY